MAISEEHAARIVTLEKLAYFKSKLDDYYGGEFVAQEEGSRLLTSAESDLLARLGQGGSGTTDPAETVTEEDINDIFDNEEEEQESGNGENPAPENP